MLKNTRVSLSNRALVGVAVASAAGMSFAADGYDPSTIVAGIAAATTIGAIVALGAVKIGPKFAKWSVNTIVGMFR